MLEELKLPSECIDDLSTVVYGQKRTELISGLIEKTKFYPYIVSCKWRVDITICSSMLSRVLEPHIVMEWIFNNGKHEIFELSLSKFSSAKTCHSNYTCRNAKSWTTIVSQKISCVVDDYIQISYIFLCNIIVKIITYIIDIFCIFCSEMWTENFFTAD